MADAPAIKMEALLPTFLEENWPVERLAQAAGVHKGSAHRFIQEKRELVRQHSQAQIIGITNGMWTTLAERASLDREALETLNQREREGKPVDSKAVSERVKRLIAILNMGKSMAPRDPDDPRNRQGCIAQQSSV